MDTSYNLVAIRQLLTEAFQPEALRRFCQDRPLFRPILADFGSGHSLNDMVDRVIDYCLRHALLPELLAAVEREFPRQYARFGPYGEQTRSEPQAPDPVALARWDENLKVYKKRMVERYGTTQIFGQPRPVPLEQVFTDVYILEKPVAFR
ncbi:MAG: hypothetical protein JXA93_12365, partial [Anaerolineae bacterium]|nr:hypothetical protein [Anaerolineae bacterium]